MSPQYFMQAAAAFRFFSPTIFSFSPLLMLFCQVGFRFRQVESLFRQFVLQRALSLLRTVRIIPVIPTYLHVPPSPSKKTQQCSQETQLPPTHSIDPVVPDWPPMSAPPAPLPCAISPANSCKTNYMDCDDSFSPGWVSFSPGGVTFSPTLLSCATLQLALHIYKLYER